MTEPMSMWQGKPWWCQPWTIVLTGVLVTLASWLVLHRWWISVPVGLAVLAWWGLFLWVVPEAYRQQQLDGVGATHAGVDHQQG